MLSPLQCLQTYECVQDNINAMQTAEPSRDILRALLILSYCPHRQHEPLFTAPDPFRAAVFAYDAAKNMCFDLLPARLSTLKAVDMKDEWNQRLLDDACLVSRKCRPDNDVLTPCSGLPLPIDIPGKPADSV